MSENKYPPGYIPLTHHELGGSGSGHKSHSNGMSGTHRRADRNGGGSGGGSNGKRPQQRNGRSQGGGGYQNNSNNNGGGRSRGGRGSNNGPRRDSFRGDADGNGPGPGNSGEERIVEAEGNFGPPRGEE